MNTFYKIDSTRVSLLEYLWWHKSPLVIISWMMKWLHIPIRCSSDDPNCETTLPCVVEALPIDIAARFEPLTNDFASLGFFDPVYHVIEDTDTSTTIYWATFRHESGNHFGRIHNRVWQQAPNPNRALFAMFFTAFTDGTFLVSSSGKPDMAAPASVQMNRMFRAPAGKLWARHEQLLGKAAEHKLISPVRTREDLIEITEQHHVRLRDFHLARGVFRPRTAEEQVQVDGYAKMAAQAQASGAENADVLVELQRLQEQKPGWKATIPILIISLILFVVIGVTRWNWEYTVLLIPILLFHECGHWVAMRLFHYRNLRMFFIPLFGAAVTGRNWNVPGWKKAIVSLAGPLPGIFLGIFLGVAGAVWNVPLMTKAAMMLIFLNGFNLLPVLPLDGGWVLHTILFCRNRWLDVVFRILAIGGLMLMGIAGLSRVFAPLAIVMAVSLPTAFKLARITDKLRTTPLPEPQLDEDQIPLPTAEAIITEVKTAFPQRMGSRQIAQHTLNVFETLNAKPPGTLGTIGLMAVQGGTFVLVLIFGLVFTISKYGAFHDFMQTAMQQPHHTYVCDSSQLWQGAEATRVLIAPHDLLVADFKRPEPAAAEFTRLTSELPPASRLTLFGDSLILSLPAGDDAARDKWFDQLQSATTNVFAVVSNQPATLDLQCIAPSLTAATNLAQAIEEYVRNGSGMHLVAPWTPEYQSPAFAAKRSARQFWKQLNETVNQIAFDPSLQAYSEKIQAASLRGASSEVARLEDEQRHAEERLATQARETLRSTSTNPVCVSLVDLHAALAEVPYTNRVERAAVLRQIAAYLGEVQYEGDKPLPEAESAGITMGMASQHGLIIRIQWMQLNDASVGLPALANWLCDQKCIGIKYDLFRGYGGSDEE